MEALAFREWTREEMYRAAEAGVFRPDERLELIDGQLVTKMSPQGDSHALCILLTEDWLRDLTEKEITSGPSFRSSWDPATSPSRT